MKIEVTRNKAQERIRNLCILAAANLEAMVGHGMKPSLEQSALGAEALLDRLEKGPVEEAEATTEG